MIILASKSPRRENILKKATKNFVIISKDIDEASSYNLAYLDAVKEISFRKAEIIAKEYPNDLVIGSDTIVVFNDKIYGKPKDKEMEKEFLKTFSNKKHKVITAYTLMKKGKVITNAIITDVYFNKLDDKFIKKFIEKACYLDKAGGYAIQDNHTFKVVKYIVGSKNNVMGFPLKEIIKDIKINFPEEKL